MKNPDHNANELEALNQLLKGLSAEERIAYSMENLPEQQVLLSSFGIQSAVMLHLVTTIQPEIPVILLDTGYLFDETYQFVGELTKRLQLNLQVYKPKYTPNQLEKQFGALWQKGKAGIAAYNEIVKIEPLERAFNELEVKTWFSGVRAQQSQTRQAFSPLQEQNGRYKLHPILEWTRKDVHYYLKNHNLPYHPLWEAGYASVGDTNTSRPLADGLAEEETRFFGLQRECGIHLSKESTLTTG